MRKSELTREKQRLLWEGKMMKEHVITPRPIPFPRPLPPIIVF